MSVPKTYRKKPVVAELSQRANLCARRAGDTLAATTHTGPLDEFEVLNLLCIEKFGDEYIKNASEVRRSAMRNNYRWVVDALAGYDIVRRGVAP